jgi:glycosyltransferase involved in cell wall biosynthesis
MTMFPARFLAERRDRRLLAASRLFDAAFYLAENPDVAQAGVDPLRHYLARGAEEGRAPHPLFDPLHYARAAGIETLARRQWFFHFLREGEASGVSPHPLIDPRRLAEGYGLERPVAGLLARFAADPSPPCNPHALFDAAYYLTRYPDVAARRVNPLVHYVGYRKALLASGLFDTAYYLAHNPDVAQVGIDPVWHYLWRGAGEGRSPHPLLDARWYGRAAGADEGGQASPLEHFLSRGAAEGRSPHPLFDPAHYARAAGIAELDRRQWFFHFLREGEARGLSPHPLVDLGRLAKGYGMERPAAGLLARFALDPSPPCNPHPLFDVAYYLRLYPDVVASGMNPLVHYLWYGTNEKRRPSPYLDAARYAAQLPGPVPGGMTLLQHYAEIGGRLGVIPSTRFDPELFAERHPELARRGIDLLAACLERYGGEVPSDFALRDRDKVVLESGYRACFRGHVDPAGKRRVLLVAHTAGDVLFGAERSFVDMVRAAGASGYAVFAVLPRVAPPYVLALLPHCAEVAVLTYEWWRGAKPPDPNAVALFRRHIGTRRIDLVHSNTIMLREPLLAARSESKPALVHVREIIERDPELTSAIGEPVAAIAAKVCELADVLVANSRTAANGYPHERARVLQNCIEVARFTLGLRPDDGTVRFGLLSSNIPKKGLGDFAALARACSTRVPGARFVAIGPITEYARKLQGELDRDGLTGAVEFTGYIDDGVSAISSVDVIVNFSHFAESFGRTVLEGMAARRPAIVYDHGALPELIKDGVNGFIVPYRDWEAAIPVVERLCADAALRGRLGEEGARTAAQFAFESYALALGEIYREALEPAVAHGSSARAQSKLPPPERVLAARSLPRPLEHSALKLAYFLWHFPVPSETFVLNELRHLVALGIDVKVFCRQSPHPDFRPDFPIGWERVATPEELAGRLVETGRNVVHAHFAYPTVTEMVWPACAASGIPFTFIAHAQDIFVRDNDARNRIGEIVRSPACLRMLALGRFHREYLLERGVPDEKLMVLHQGIDCSLHPLRSGSRPRGRKVVAVQRFVAKKGLDRLIRAAVLLREDGVKVELYGYGPDEPALKSLAAAERADNVIFMGAVSGRAQLLEVLAEADLCIAPSVRAPSGDMDGIPTILMEAMAVGVPVLATPLASIPDLVVPGVTGFIAEDADPPTLARSIRAALAAPAAQIDAMVHAARGHIEQCFNTHRQVPALLRLWCARAVDIVIVSWNNLPELQEVIARVFRFTRLPFHLIVCDNASTPDVREFLHALHRERDNVTVIDRGFNSYVGPGTNCAIDHGSSECIVYLCGKEGFILQQGWERSIIDYMDAHPEVGLAGTLGHSPSYLRGADYGQGIELFGSFRNRDFAAAHPQREFRHVQGGLFAVRRRMYEEIGGFSEEVPHQYTDVEYSYYVESCGWQLGEIPEILALYNKTRPPLASRFTERVLAVHPPRLQDLPQLDGAVEGRLALCNVCQSFLAEGFDGNACCPKCGATRAARTLMRALAESTLTYRRLKALVVEPPPGIGPFLAQQFQGRQVGYSELVREISVSGRIEGRTGSLEVAYLGDRNGQIDALTGLTDELARVLAPGAPLYVDSSAREAVADARFQHQRELRYASRAVGYAWAPLHLFVRVP